MKRRDFLTALLGSTAAALVLPQLDLIASTLPVTLAPEIADAQLWQFTFESVHDEAAKMFREQMHQRDLTPQLCDHARLGEGLLRHQLSIGLPPWYEMEAAGSAAHARYFVPAIASLAARAESVGLDTYGRLNVNLPGCDYSANRDTLRMIAQYDIATDSYFVRWDVIGGSSPHGQRIARRVNETQLKRSIQRRVRDYTRLPLPA